MFLNQSRASVKWYGLHYIALSTEPWPPKYFHIFEEQKYPSE